MSVSEQRNNPLHGLKAETMMAELVKFYGWDILYAAIGLKCFQTNPTIPSCLTFLKKTEWARLKVENFYLYRFKRMPKASAEQFELKPRERGFANGIVPKEPMPLTVEQIAEMKAQSEKDHKARTSNERRSNSRY
jgi:uncharacterized protein (DUF2132 family)